MISPKWFRIGLKTYHEQTAAVVGYYQKKNAVIVNVDAAQDIDQVSSAIFQKLDSLK